MFRLRGSVALQEQAAVALCGFFSVPLTYKDTGTSDMWGKVKKMTLEKAQIQRPTLVKVKGQREAGTGDYCANESDISFKKVYKSDWSNRWCQISAVQ